MWSSSQPVVVGLPENWNHHVEGIRCAAAMGGRIDQRVDDLQLLDDRPGPAVRNDQRQRVLVLRADVNEVDVQSVDLGDEVGIGVQLRLDLAPVVLIRPVAHELLNGRERHALRIVADGFALGEAGRQESGAQIGEVCLGNVDAEGPDGLGRNGGAHGTGLVDGFIFYDRVHWSSPWLGWRPVTYDAIKSRDNQLHAKSPMSSLAIKSHSN